ncbi:MAG: restriction endonuclease [Planctomycetota bacterium]
MDIQERLPTCDDLLRVADSLENPVDQNPIKIEESLEYILEALMSRAGYGFRERESDMPPFDDVLDFYGYRAATNDSQAESIGFMFKRFSTPVDLKEAEALIAESSRVGCHRCVFISPSGFTGHALSRSTSISPDKLELFDIPRLKNWILESHDLPQADYASRMSAITSRFAHEAALLIAESPVALDSVEWRQLEQILERVFKDFGFNVTLTREGKDGGRDLILRWRAVDGERVILVELKHWRSGQRVKKGPVEKFTQVVLRDGAEKGVLLSTSGFASNAFSTLAKVRKERLNIGGRESIYKLCELYKKHGNGIWSPPSPVEAILLDNTNPLIDLSE